MIGLSDLSTSPSPASSDMGQSQMIYLGPSGINGTPYPNVAYAHLASRVLGQAARPTMAYALCL